MRKMEADNEDSTATAMAPAGVSHVEQRELIRKIICSADMKEGDIWYLLDTHWYKQWKKYVGSDAWDRSEEGTESAWPGPIDNSPILKKGGKECEEDLSEIQPNLTESFDFCLMPGAGWEKLVDWFGLAAGQHPIARRVISQGLYIKHLKVEVYMTEVKLCVFGNEDEFEKKVFSRADKLGKVVEVAREHFKIEKEQAVRLWSRYLSSSYERLEHLDQSLQEQSIYTGQVLVVEVRKEDGTWPKTSYTSSSGVNSYQSYSNYQYQTAVDEGLTGLANLGNTCFMNSAIQCLSNVPQLTDYFLQREYIREINKSNPLGMKGHIAEAYGELMKEMWGKKPAVTPRSFKSAVGRFAPRFTGYQQHDSQELLAFLLDGLHEDLNRVVTKPYVEVKDSDGRPDDEVAEEAWINHLSRNRSVIVDHIQGQYKSTLVCPDCQKVSVTFDPFMYLTLPLPVKKTKRYFITLVRLDPTKCPQKYCLTVRKDGCVSHLADALSKVSDIPSDQLFFADIYYSKIYKTLFHSEHLSGVNSNDSIFAYELSADPNMAKVAVYHKEENSYLFGLPMIIPVSRKSTTYGQLYDRVVYYMRRFVQRPCPSPRVSDQDGVTLNSKREEEGGQPMEWLEENDKGEDEPCGQQKRAKTLHEVATAGDDTDEPDEPDMFEMSFVNSSGNSVMKELGRERPIAFQDTITYMLLTWSYQSRQSHFDEKAAKDVFYDRPPSSEETKKSHSLYDCLQLFTATETLGKDDLWYCSKCEKHQMANKTMLLWKLPEVLVVHLKRFTYTRWSRDKLDTFIDFPVEDLDMTDYVQKKEKGDQAILYDLCAVSNHYGGLGGGHYTAYCKNKTTGGWHHFDDSSVTRVDDAERTVRSKAAYVLIYLKKSVVSKANDGQKKEEEQANEKVEEGKTEQEEQNEASNEKMGQECDKKKEEDMTVVVGNKGDEGKTDVKNEQQEQIVGNGNEDNGRME